MGSGPSLKLDVAELFQGLRDVVPMLVGTAPFGVLFGMLAVGAGLSSAAAVGSSLVVFAGSSQFVAAKLVADGAGLLLIVLTTWIINLRHALYGASIAPYVRDLGPIWKFALSFLLTDEAYAVAISRYERDGGNAATQSYHLGVAVGMYLSWNLWTAAGLVAGGQLSGLSTWGLDFALVVTFLGIVVPMVVGRPKVLAAGVAFVVAVLAEPLPHHLGLVVASIAGIAVGWWADPRRRSPLPLPDTLPETSP
ncbi:MAG: AzlC family ABC transporter permease [Acidobacteriota bacterium]